MFHYLQIKIKNKKEKEMTNKQYKNIIQMTLLNKENTTGKEDVEVLKKVFDNCGVPFPTGTKEEVTDALKGGTYIDWSPCSAAEAQAAANEGIASVAISKTKAYVVEPEGTDTLSASAEINSVYSVNATALTAEEEESTEFFAQAKFEYDADGNISVMSVNNTNTRAITEDHLISQGNLSIVYPNSEKQIHENITDPVFTCTNFYGTVCGKTGASGTIKDNGCAICSVAMFIMSKLNLSNTNNDDVYNAVKQATILSTDNNVDFLQNNSFRVTIGNTTKSITIQSVSNYESLIMYGNVCIIYLKEGNKQHYVIADDYDSNESDFLDACLVSDADGGVHRTLREAMIRRGFTQSTSIIEYACKIV